MKNLLFFIICLSFSVLSIRVMAQTNLVDVDVPESLVDFSTFTGIVALISLCVTQASKLIPIISTNTILKIVTSLAVGIGLSFLAWKFQWAIYLDGLEWWQVLLQGTLAGFSACGFYDLIKNLIKKE